MVDAAPAISTADSNPTSPYDDAGFFAPIPFVSPAFAAPQNTPALSTPQLGMRLLELNPFVGIAKNILQGIQQPQYRQQPIQQQQPAYYTPINQGYAPGTILMRKDGGDLINWEQIPPLYRQQRMAEFVFQLSHQIEAPEPLWTNCTSKEFMEAFYYAAKEQGRQIRSFEPNIGQISFIEDRWYIHASEKVDGPRREGIANEFVNLALKVGRKRITHLPKNLPEEMKLLIWKLSQKYNLVVDFNPPVEWKRACGLPDNYMQPGMMIGKHIYGWERMPHNDRHPTLKYYLETRQRMEGGVVTLDDGSDLFKNSAIVLAKALAIPVRGHNLTSGAIYAFNDQLWINDFDALSPEEQIAFAKPFVSCHKIFASDFIDVGGKTEPYKQAVWLAAQEQKAACGFYNERREWIYYDPGSKFKKAHGFDKDYRQPGTTENGVLYGLNNIPPSQWDFAISYHVGHLKQYFGNVIKFKEVNQAYIDAVVPEGMRQDVEFFGYSPKVRIMNGKIVCRAYDEHDRETQKQIVSEGFRIASEQLGLPYVPFIINPASDKFTKAMIKEGQRQNRQVVPCPN